MLQLMVNSLAAVSGFLALVLAGFVIIRNTRARSNQLLALGLTILGLFQVFLALPLFIQAPLWRLAIFRFAMGLSAAIPPVWLAFTVIFAEWNGGTHYARWRPAILGLAAAGPLVWIGLFMDRVIVPVRLAPSGPVVIGVDLWGKAFQAAFLVGLALVLLHTENLYRQADQKTRHRIKFLAVGIFAGFTSQIVMISYTLLYGVLHPWYPPLSALGFLTGEVLIAFSVVRHRLLQVDIFVSRYVVYRSLSLALIGGYLIVLGGLAELARTLDIGLDLATITLLGGLGAAGLALILLSERVRRQTQLFLHTHFFKHKYDFRLEWMEAVRRLSHATTISDIAAQTVRRILEVMWVRQAAMYVVTGTPGVFSLAYQSLYDRLPATLNLPPGLGEQLQTMVSLLVSREGQQVPPSIPSGFAEAVGGVPIGMVVPVAALDNLAGILVVGPEVSGKPFGVDDWDLLAAVAVQVGALILNARLSQEASEGRALQVLARLSAFVAHDLKNSVGMLSLLAENAPSHMHKPEFQADAIRTLSQVTERMQRLLSELRASDQKPALSTTRGSLARAVDAWMSDLKPRIPPRITLETHLAATPDIAMDPEQLRSVFLNLLLNAIDAIAGEGRITVETGADEHWATLVVSDTGHGMSASFLRDHLFHPFQTTKPRGLGIGLYQCRHIVRGLGGELTADSTEGVGTRMTVRLPVASGSGADEQVAAGSSQLAGDTGPTRMG
jgi:putative PEP-CTERM system histidine kinase